MRVDSRRDYEFVKSARNKCFHEKCDDQRRTMGSRSRSAPANQSWCGVATETRLLSCCDLRPAMKCGILILNSLSVDIRTTVFGGHEESKRSPGAAVE